MKVYKAQKVNDAFLDIADDTYNKYGKAASLRLRKCLMLLQVQMNLHPNWFEELDKVGWSIKVNVSSDGIPQIVTSRGKRKSHLYHVKASNGARLEWVKD